MASIPQRNY